MELAPRRGFTVARITGDDIRDIYLVGSFVAGELAARAVERSTPELLRRLEALHGELVAAAERGDLVALESLNFEFHREINLAADSPKLAWVINMTSRFVPRRFYATIEGWPEVTVDEHLGLLNAFRTEDAELAREIFARHMMHAGELLTRHVDARLAAHSAPVTADAGA